MDGRIWRRVKRRDRSEGAAGPVRRVVVTPEVERAALAAAGHDERGHGEVIAGGEGDGGAGRDAGSGPHGQPLGLGRRP